jgi:hypothetical protein
MGNALNGSVVLRGVKIDLDTDIGAGFTLDCCRHVEELLTAEQLKAKYQLSEEAWRQLADNEPLQQAVERQKERRIRSGETAKERAQFLFLAAPSVLSGIFNDSTASARSRIAAIAELRQTAAIGSEAATPVRQRAFHHPNRFNCGWKQQRRRDPDRQTPSDRAQGRRTGKG